MKIVPMPWQSDFGLMGALAEIKLRSLINSQRNPIQR